MATHNEYVGVRIWKEAAVTNTIKMIKSSRIGLARHVARMGEIRNAYNILVGEPEGKRPLGRPRRRWQM